MLSWVEKALRRQIEKYKHDMYQNFSKITILSKANFWSVKLVIFLDVRLMGFDINNFWQQTENMIFILLCQGN